MDLEQFCRELAEVLHLPSTSITPDSAFEDIPRFDSAAQIELILLLDERYGVQLPEETLPRLRTIRDLGPIVAKLRLANA
ncbi:MAG: acyl carrier protein [Chloroflexi bacterium]|nr:acyl carrier protein [Chloroflexota bacterium]